MPPQDPRHRARDPRVAQRRGVQPVTRAGELPARRERVHDDHPGVRRRGPGHDRLVDLVEGGPVLAPGEHRHQGDLRSWRLGPDRGHRLLDPDPLQVRRYRHVVVAGLHDDQRGPERAQVDPGDLGGDRALPAEAGVYVAGPGHPVHEGVPVQLTGEQHGPGPGRILRPHPGGERRADDRDGRNAGPPAGLKLLFTPCQQRDVAPLARALRAGRAGRQRAGDGLGRGDHQQNEKADCEGGCQPPETSPGHGQVSVAAAGRVKQPGDSLSADLSCTRPRRSGAAPARLIAVRAATLCPFTPGKGLPWPTLFSCVSARLSC